MQTIVPGTSMPYEEGGMFALFRPMIRATDGLTLRQVCSLTGLEPKYRERQLARILLISALRDCMKIDSIGALLATVNGNADDTGDDIISEEQLYDYLCAIIGRASGELSVEVIPSAVAAVTKDYVPTDDTALSRLNEALTVMVYAYTAGIYKQEADKRLQKIREKYHEN